VREGWEVESSTDTKQSLLLNCQHVPCDRFRICQLAFPLAMSAHDLGNGKHKACNMQSLRTCFSLVAEQRGCSGSCLCGVGITIPLPLIPKAWVLGARSLGFGCNW